MPIKNFISFSLLMFITLLVKSQNMGFTIYGKLNGVDTGNVIMRTDNGQELIAQGRIEFGKFKLTGHVKEPVKCTITMNFNYEAIPIFLENASYNLLIDNSPFTYKLTGGLLNEEFMTYINTIMGFYEGYSEIESIRRKYPQDSDTGNLRMIRDKLDSSLAFLNHSVVKITGKLVKENAHSYMAPRMISNLLLFQKSNADIARRYYFMLDEKIKSSSEAKYLERQIENIMTTPKVGTDFPAFTLSNEKGEDFSFIKPSKGGYLLLNFWATWCGPCLQEFPSMVKIYKNFKDKGFEMINISIDTDKKRWLKYITLNKYPWLQLIDNVGTDSSIAKIYRINSIPANFLIDDNMKIIAFDLSNQELNEFLNEKYKAQ